MLKSETFGDNRVKLRIEKKDFDDAGWILEMEKQGGSGIDGHRLVGLDRTVEKAKAQMVMVAERAVRLDKKQNERRKPLKLDCCLI